MPQRIDNAEQAIAYADPPKRHMPLWLKWLAIVVIILLLGAGGFAVWYYHYKDTTTLITSIFPRGNEPSPSPTVTVGMGVPTVSPTPFADPRESLVVSPTPTASSTPSPTPSVAATPTPSPTPQPTSPPSSTPTPTPTPSLTYSNTAWGFSFTGLPDWNMAVMDASATTKIVYNPATGTSYGRIDRYAQDPSTSLNTIKQQLQNSPDVTLIESVAVNGTPALRFWSKNTTLPTIAIIKNQYLFYISGSLTQQSILNTFVFN